MATPLAVDLGNSVESAFTTFANFVPRFIGFLLILVIGYFIAKFVSKLVAKALEKAGFDRAVEKGGIKKALAKSKYDASDIVAKIVFFFIFIPVLSAAIGQLGIDALTQPLADLISLLPRILVALIIIVIGAAIAQAVKSLLQNALGGLSYGNLVATAASILILILFVKAALDQVGVATTVTGPLLIALLATAGGIAIVGVGGGLIQPMQRRWEDALVRAGDERQNMSAQLQASRSGQQGDNQAYSQQGGEQAYPVDPAYDPQYAPADDDTQSYSNAPGATRRRR